MELDPAGAPTHGGFDVVMWRVGGGGDGDDARCVDGDLDGFAAPRAADDLVRDPRVAVADLPAARSWDAAPGDLDHLPDELVEFVFLVAPGLPELPLQVASQLALDVEVLVPVDDRANSVEFPFDDASHVSEILVEVHPVTACPLIARARWERLHLDASVENPSPELVGPVGAAADPCELVAAR